MSIEITLDHAYSVDTALEEAVRESVHRDETVILFAIDPELAEAAAAKLADLCDGSVDLSAGDGIPENLSAVRQYWGAYEDEDGDAQDWRIHLHVRRAKIFGRADADEYVQAWGSWDAIVATAEQGVADEDRDRLADAGFDPDQAAEVLLAYCRERVSL